MSGCRQSLPPEDDQPPGEDRYCGRTARWYRTGWRCPDHTPARENGRPEPPEPQEKR
ncbi:hypothetical protein RMN57_13000 [Kitasatospora sp. CM 4170]|uniref:Uncharacterized protein n=1 Tax=Kitasatospora aburaviensis TaxID=67265 RepID=A0ABW1F3T4_9ACTN|nr:hypothetical protein [Kitasatospora sp. CM 4170]WNM45571.1 hypothetical protein RMN57_13000 [Kitasatospora sp. CM 4170]